MEYRFRLQDPMYPPRDQLVEILSRVFARKPVARVRALVAFVTGKGLEDLIRNETVKAVFDRKPVYVLVGLNAVTDRAALELLRELERRNKSFQARVILTPAGTIYHPKTFHVEYEDGDGVLVVGSNNLTPNGLEKNIEVYSELYYTSSSVPDLSAWDAFLERWQGHIRPIDDEAIAIAEDNAVYGYGVTTRDLSRLVSQDRPAVPTYGNTGRGGKKNNEKGKLQLDIVDGMLIGAHSEDQVLVAELPKAGDRWAQAHFSVEVSERFFGHKPVGSRQIWFYLFDVDSQKTEHRPLTFSESNRNVKIQLAAAQGRQYPSQGRPIVVMRRVGIGDQFRYKLLMPGDSGYAEMHEFLHSRSAPKGNQMARTIAPLSEVLEAWPACPV